MHCPQCGQQQSPGEVRFCSRCGLPLGAVSDLVANGGIPPTYVTEGEKTRSPMRIGVQQGATLIMLGIITTILFGILNNYLGTPEFLVALSAVIGFVGGPLRILYALIFEESAAKQQAFPQTYVPPNTNVSFGGHARPSALPPAQNPPMPAYRPRQHTAEILRPPSVTEGTTRLLEKEKDPSEQ